MKVILTRDVPKVGKDGEIVAVADGYAHNYLFPRQLAVVANRNAASSAVALPRDPRSGRPTKMYSAARSRAVSAVIDTGSPNSTPVLKNVESPTAS